MVCFMNTYPLEICLILCTCSLSLIFSFLVIYIIYKKKLFKTYSFKILAYISLNDFLRSLIGIFGSLMVQNYESCIIYGFFDDFFFVSNMVWALCLTFTIHQIIVQEEPYYEKYHNYWIIASFLAVSILQSLPLITNSYGLSVGVCALLTDEMGTIWRFSVLFAPSLLMLIAIIILSIQVFRKVKILGHESFNGVIFERGLIYALIISLVLIPYIIIRVVQIFFENCDALNSAIIMFIFYNLQGFLNAIVFFKNKTVKILLFRKNQNLNATLQSQGSLCISFASDIN